MTTNLNIPCPVCRTSNNDNEHYCASCGWVLRLPYNLLVMPAPSHLTAENKALKIRRTSWQQLEKHLAELKRNKQDKAALRKEHKQLQTSISDSKKEIESNGLQEKQLLTEIGKLEKSLAIKKKNAQIDNKPVHRHVSKSILPKIREKKAEIIDVKSQISAPKTILLIFNNPDDLKRFNRCHPELVLGIHRTQKIYVVAQAEFIYKFSTDILNRREWINGCPALAIKIHFDLEPNNHHVLAVYSSVESFLCGTFFRIDLPDVISGETQN